MSGPEGTSPADITTRFGVVGLFGRANAGKSTLVNALVGEQVSIVSAKPQTTRKRILGILTRGPDQIVFADTPGLHAVRNRLDAFMAAEIEQTLPGLQAGLYLVDAEDPWPEEDKGYLQDLLPRLKGPLLLVLNKTETLRPPARTRLAATYRELLPDAPCVMVSAREKQGLDELLQRLWPLLPPGPHAYDDEYYTDQTEREIVAEVLREEALVRFYHEVPHSVAVLIDEFKERDNGKTYISAQLVVERESQKKILIGKGGDEIKGLGRAARLRLNRMLGRDTFLELWIKVRPNWRKQEEWVRRFGYVR